MGGGMDVARDRDVFRTGRPRLDTPAGREQQGQQGDGGVSSVHQRPPWADASSSSHRPDRGHDFADCAAFGAIAGSLGTIPSLPKPDILHKL